MSQCVYCKFILYVIRCGLWLWLHINEQAKEMYLSSYVWFCRRFSPYKGRTIKFLAGQKLKTCKIYTHAQHQEQLKQLDNLNTHTHTHTHTTILRQTKDCLEFAIYSFTHDVLCMCATGRIRNTNAATIATSKSGVTGNWQLALVTQRTGNCFCSTWQRHDSMAGHYKKLLFL